MAKEILKFFAFFLTISFISCAINDKNYSKKCKEKPVDFSIDGINYFYNGFLKDSTDKRATSWTIAREICKSYCSDLMSVDTQREFEEMQKMMEKHLIEYLWTSGHVCEKNNCDANSEPININGWMWLDKNIKMPPTNKIPPGWTFNPWSHTGHKNVQQPDNAEFDLFRRNESCLAVLHNVYDDGIKFHDVACYHKKNFFCES
ncbi:hypothetical protein PVAND_016107 [Polypedilum vanderplanki]|uniref:C-type lectin domain-containing protein n=1 Tax=Polypedilum vanderplanki TaxID=319348 RepID=A0A9J6BF87_POLVA|nr:hypothetical protein PVAND_016107 [Polypedilum vanderplanki]